MQKIANGIYKYQIGTPDPYTPVSFLKPAAADDSLKKLEDISCPFNPSDIKSTQRKSGLKIEIPLNPKEDIYGLGLMLKSFKQTGKKKKLRTNSDPAADTGDSHAPVPFYASTEGYGVLVDTSRYVTFYCGNCKEIGSKQDIENFMSGGTEVGHWEAKSGSGNMFIDIPATEGVDIYIFCGTDIKDVVARYNLFCGGGAYVPLWGLGVLYRAYINANQDETLSIARKMREDKIPCDTFGLEPGWQTHAYSSTYLWDEKRFPHYEEMLLQLRKDGFKPNLWQHAYTHPDSPIFNKLKPYSGDYYVWDGLVPDFSIPEAREIFLSQQRKLRDNGVLSFKLDEGDNSDFTSNWGFPDFSSFPSGMDGEQMHTLFGTLYEKTMLQLFEEKGQRTFGQARQSTACASSFPYVIYSDLYDHVDFVRGMASSAFSGILWSPEVRQTESEEELLRRIQAVVCSPQAVINCWMIPSPPWKQFEYYKNMNGEFLENADELTKKCKKIFDLRMSLIPHFYTAYHNYYKNGIPPVRPIVMDYPDDMNTRDIYDEYMIGEGLLAAPVVFGQGNHKRIYLPEGFWYDFSSGVRIQGGCYIEREVPLEEIPMFVKEGTLLCLAKPLLYVEKETVFEITLRAYGNKKCSATLIVDDGFTTDYKVNPPLEAVIVTENSAFIVDGGISSRYVICALEEVNANE